MKLITDAGETYSGALTSTTYKNAFTFAKTGSTKVTHLGLQTFAEDNLGAVEIKAFNIIDKNGNKIPLVYTMDGWSGITITPGNVIDFTQGGQWNSANITGAEGKYFPRFRFTISADEFVPNLQVKINTEIHDGNDNAYYNNIPAGTEPYSFDIEMEEGDKITGMVIHLTEAASSPFTLTNVAVTIQEVTTAEIGEYEWATFVSSKALDFTGSDVKAYAVTGHSGTSVTRSGALTKVPANTPLLLNAPQGSYNIPVIESAEAIGTNLLKAGTGAAVSAESGKTKYVLSVTAGKAEFQKINTTAATVPTGKAYLEFNEAIEARSLDIDEGGTTAIDVINKKQDASGDYYDLQGRRVAQPKKGLYIVNGKKVIIK